MSQIIFMTGVTGNIGGRVLAELLGRTDAQFKVLVTGKDDTIAKKKIEDVLRFWGVDPLGMNRIEVLRGDITHPRLGLSDEIYNRIGPSLTHIIHCAANIKFNQTIEEARKSIVDGTKYVLRLAEPARKNGAFRKFNFFSTMEITGTFSGLAKEEYFTNTPRKFLNTYEQAKSEAEDFLRQEHEQRQLAITIYRPSMVVGESTSGKVLHFQSFYQMINNVFLKPQAPIMPGHDHFMIDTVPIDLIAAFVYESYDAVECNGQIYHLTLGTSEAVHLLDFAKMVLPVLEQKAGQKMKAPVFVPPRLIWMLNKIAYPFSFGKVRRQIYINLIFLQFFFLRVRFDNSRAKDFMTRRGYAIAPLKAYLPNLVDYYLRHKDKGENSFVH